MVTRGRRTLSSRHTRGRPSRIILPPLTPSEPQLEQEEERQELPTHVDLPSSNAAHPLHSGVTRTDARCRSNWTGSSSKAKPSSPIQQCRTPLDRNYDPSLNREVDMHEELLFSLVPPLRNGVSLSRNRTISTHVDRGSRSTGNERVRPPSPVQPCQESGPRDHGQQQLSTPLQQRRATVVGDDTNPSPVSDEAMQGQPTNVDPPSRNSVDASQVQRRGRNRGTNEPTDRHLRTFIRVLGKSFVPHSVVAEISASVGYHLHGSWKSWSQYPQYMKQKLWENFKKKEQAREISEIELYERTHRSKQGLGEYSCKKAKAVREMYDNLMEDKYLSDPTSMPPFDPDVWREAIGGVIKGRAYGLGSQDPYAILGNAATERSSKAK